MGILGGSHIFLLTQIVYHIAKTPGTFSESLAISYWDFLTAPFASPMFNISTKLASHYLYVRGDIFSLSLAVIEHDFCASEAQPLRFPSPADILKTAGNGANL